MIKYLFKKIGRYSLIMITCFTLWFTTSSQDIVYDPTNASNILSLGETMGELKKLKEDIMNSAEFLNKVLANTHEVKRLLSILNTMVCSTDEFNLFLGFIGDINACNERLNIDITLTKLDGISGKVTSLLSGAIAMTQYESIKSLKDLNDELENGIRQLAAINTSLKYDVFKKLKEDHTKKEGYKSFSFTNKANL